MSYSIKELKNHHVDTCNPDDGWISARPLIEPFICRLKDAWMVLIGRYDAVRWEGGQ